MNSADRKRRAKSPLACVWCYALIFITPAWHCGVAAASSPDGTDFFEKHVRPILVARCQECHGPEKQESDLRLDSSAGAAKGGVYGPAVIPGKPEESLLVLATSYQDDDLKMPPRGPLGPEEVAVLRRWVEIGAPWPEESRRSDNTFDLAERKARHWAWKPVQKAKVPDVTNKAWPRGEFDHFVLARLEAEGLKPAPDADRRTLIRRAYLDLVGLLPSPEEVAEFVADESDDAFESVVDRLLASPHFGERWARHWFDLVRYAETYGHEADYTIPHAWQYRDYVIRALNEDVPYNQFVMEHIAGDLVTPPRLNSKEKFNESIIGTGFWFMFEQTHSPTDIRQHEADRVDNQIDVMTKAFLGIAVGCARCHDHKFDAISTRDYYALAGFLKSSRQQIAYLDRQGQIDGTAKRLSALQAKGTKLLHGAVPQSGSSAELFAKYLLAAREVENGGEVSEVARRANINRERLDAWVAALRGPVLSRPSHPLYVWAKLKSSRQEFQSAKTELANQIRGLLSTRTENPQRQWLIKRGDRNGFAGWFFSGWAFGKAGADDAIWNASSDKPALTVPGVLTSGAIAKHLQGAARSPTFIVSSPELHVRVRGQGQIRVVVDNYMLDEVQKLLFDGLIAKFDTGEEFKWVTIKGDLGKYVGERAYLSLEDDGTGCAEIDETVLSNGSVPEDPASSLLVSELEAGRADSMQSLAGAYGRIWDETLRRFDENELDYDHAQLLNWAMANNLVELPPLAQKLAALRTEIEQLETSLPEPMRVLAIEDGTGQDEHVYRRGKHQNLGDVVSRRFLEAVDGEDQPSCGAGSGRLELARRMVDSADPLFARVAVNRIWNHLFGRGIVATVDNLGAQGEPPTHPELLDRLADSFVNDGWSQKRLIRQLMLSRTYQMSSRPEDAAAEGRDPANLLLHRASVWRLEAEPIRDTLLQVSGRLKGEMFGPSVPAYLDPFIESKFQPKTSGPLDGNGRRSVYLEVRRNYLQPMLLAFDMPTPFTCVGRRNISNVPAQALTMLNDPFVQSLAHDWAKRTLAEFSGGSPHQRIERMYEVLLCRSPTAGEFQAAESFLQEQSRFVDASANEHDSDRELSLWTDFAQVLFNEKEFVLRN